MNSINFHIEPLEEYKENNRYSKIEIPRFPRGPYPPASGTWESLCPDQNSEEDLPFFCSESLVLDLVQDEARFRKKNMNAWVERCWFLHGRILRGPDGELWGMIDSVVPAKKLKATKASFEFGPETWTLGRIGIDDKNKILLGWVHTHSINFLTGTGGKERNEPNGREPSKQEKGIETETREETDVSSGLFLSIQDRESALKRGFSGPFQVTCVLDSDRCLDAEQDMPLDKLFGVWGWQEGTLCRRSINIIRDNPIK